MLAFGDVIVAIPYDKYDYRHLGINNCDHPVNVTMTNTLKNVIAVILRNSNGWRVGDYSCEKIGSL